jgi:urease accessory protein
VVSRPGECQRPHIRVARGAQLEWLPQPSIVYDGARVDQSLRVDLDGRLRDARIRVHGARPVVDGRTLRQWMAYANQFGSTAHGRPIWQESTDAAADAPLWRAQAGWAGRVVCASVWAIGGSGATWDDAALVNQWRAALQTASERVTGREERLLGGATRMATRIVLAKILGDEADTVAELAQHLWALARPAVLGSQPNPCEFRPLEPGSGVSTPRH